MIDQVEFAQLGIARIPNAFTRAEAADMQAQIWSVLTERHGLQPHAPETWTLAQPTGFQHLTQARAFQALGSPHLMAALDEMLGMDAWTRPKHWGMPLVTFPQPATTPWMLTSRAWHLDFAPRGPALPLQGIRILAFVAPVKAQGGGTLVLAGSHRLVEQYVGVAGPDEGHSADVRARLGRTHPWLAELWSGKLEHERDPHRTMRYIEQGTVIDRVPLRVIELTGEAGDIVLMHPWAFHAASMNCGTAPRMMVSQSIFRKG